MNYNLKIIMFFFEGPAWRKLPPTTQRSLIQHILKAVIASLEEGKI
jgi:hypothetical protein